MLIPTFHTRFYIRTKQSKRGEEFTPLRLKVWVSATKSYLYLSTNLSVSPWQWSAFASDGTPGTSADPKLAKSVDRYRAAVSLVVSSAIVNNRIHAITSADFKSKVEGVISRMEANERSGNNQTIVVYASPNDVPTCAGCVFRSSVCRAPWSYQQERDFAPEAAAFNGICRKRVSGGLWQPNPNKPGEPMPERLLNAIKAQNEREEV